MTFKTLIGLIYIQCIISFIGCSKYRLNILGTEISERVSYTFDKGDIKCWRRKSVITCNVEPKRRIGESNTRDGIVPYNSKTCPAGHVNQCVYVAGLCPDGTVCSNNATCIPDPYHRTYKCKCKHGFAGNGYQCGTDTDLDGYPDIRLNCTDESCYADNCHTPNSDQTDVDKNGIGDVCEDDSDKDNVKNTKDNCQLVHNKDQKDVDNDKVGDLCDNCVHISNSDQMDTDGDGFGNTCDNDIDNDGIQNNIDNCPHKKNIDQLDTDGDKVGDACDNCPSVSNLQQDDEDEDEVGNACDNNIDSDNDGIQDDLDNCPYVSNPSQVDTDGDKRGDACDRDQDNDGVPNRKDNCPLVKNKNQLDGNDNGIGDACEEDWDGDGIPNDVDICPNNPKQFKTDFRKSTLIDLDPIRTTQPSPVWEIYDKGRDIIQYINSDPGLVVSDNSFDGVDYEGTFFVHKATDKDYIGFPFAFQNNRKFYLLTWKKERLADFGDGRPKEGVALPGLQLKVINSRTGPGPALRSAIWNSNDTPNEVRLLWTDPQAKPWEHTTSYRWLLYHRPAIGLIRVLIHNGRSVITDTGNIFDTTIGGGKVGVFSYSQDSVVFSNLVHRCNNDVPQPIYDSLPKKLKKKVRVDLTSLLTFVLNTTRI